MNTLRAQPQPERDEAASEDLAQPTSVLVSGVPVRDATETVVDHTAPSLRTAFPKHLARADARAPLDDREDKVAEPTLCPLNKDTAVAAGSF